MTWSLTLAALPRAALPRYTCRCKLKTPPLQKKLSILKDPRSLKPHPKTISKFGTKNELYFFPGIGKQRGGTKDTALYQINMDLVTSLRVN